MAQATKKPTKAAKPAARKPAKRVAKTAAKTTAKAVAKHEAPAPGEAARKLARVALERLARAASALSGSSRRVAAESLLARARTLPIQKSIDVAVPLEVAWDEWTAFEFLPEGTHRVTEVERDGDGHLVGRVHGLHVERDWEAEVVDERQDESFAWHSVGGSDVSGLATFHRLSDRLTRIELHLDVMPAGLADALALVLRFADRRAEAELRRFKAHVEALDPDEYEDEPQDEPEDEAEDEYQDEPEDGYEEEPEDEYEDDPEGDPDA